MTYFRAKAYQVVGLPGRPKVRIPVAFGSLIAERQRAQNLVTFMQKVYTGWQTVLQEVRYGS